MRKDLDSVQAKQDYHLRMFRRHLFDDASAIASQLAEETVNMHLGGAGGGARTGGRHRHGGHRRHVQHISADTNDYNYSHPHLTGSDNANNVHNNNTTPNNSGYNRDEYDDDRYEYIHRGGTNGANDDDDHITESSGTRRGRDTDRERSRGRERKRNKDANRSKHKSISFRK